MTTMSPNPVRVWTGPTRVFTLTVGWGYVACVLVLGAVSTLAAFLV